MKHVLQRFLPLLLALFVGAAPAWGQITIEEGDLTETLGKRIAIQSIVAKDTLDFQAQASALFSQTGGGQTFDFTPFTYDQEFEGIQDRVPIGEAPAGVPFLSEFEQRGATTVTATQFNALDPEATDSTFWSFEAFTDEGFQFYGASFLSTVDLDGDGTVPDSAGLQYQPARLQFELPLTNESAWQQTTDFVFLPDTLGFATQQTDESEVDGWGTLVTPAGTVEVLRVRTTSTDTTSFGGFVQVTRTTQVQFISRDFSLSASIFRQDDSGELSLSYTVIANAGESYDIAQGATSSVESPELGMRLQFTDASSTAGQLDVSRYDTAPFNNEFSGSAESDDGTTVTPNTVWEGRYFGVRNQGLTDFTANFCIDVSTVPGINDDGKLVVLTRETSDDPWTAVNSMLDGSFLCGTGLTGFSQFAVGGDSTSNPLPVELSGLTAVANGRDAVLRWETASETNNAGFRVEHRAGTDAWTQAGFVEGAGTTAEPQRYTFRVADLDAGTHAFRLRQVDVDGTTDLSDVVTVQMRPETAFVLSDVRPHPVRDGATFTLSVREAQDVTVEVFDLLGRRVKTLHDGVVAAGGQVDLQIDTAGMTSGMYLLRAVGEGHQVTRKVMVVR